MPNIASVSETSISSGINTEHAVKLMSHFNTFLQSWIAHFSWKSTPKHEKVELTIQIEQFFQLHFLSTDTTSIQVNCHYDQLNWLQQPDIRKLCYYLMSLSLQHGLLYSKLLEILYRHCVASATIPRRDYFELIYSDLMLLQSKQNNSALLFGQPAHEVDPTLLKRMKYLDCFDPAFQHAWMALQSLAFKFLSQLKTAVSYIKTDFPTTWYDIRYCTFELKHYYKMSEQWIPYLGCLFAWYHENDNKLYWFLLSNEQNGVDNINYFSYSNLMQLQRGGVPLFEHKAQARRLFQLPIVIFNYVMICAFHEIKNVPWWPALFLRWALQPHIIDEMKQLSLPKFDHMERGLSTLWHVFERNSDILQLIYLPNYAYALNAIWQDFAYERVESHDCLDFIFGRQIHNHLYSNDLNIALIHHQTTSNSLKHHSEVWHRQSRLLSAYQFPFNYAPYRFRVGEVDFKLIASSAELKTAAKELKNCLLSFAEKISKREYFAFIVTADDELAALGIHYDIYYSIYKFDQCYGIHNEPVDASLKRNARKFVDYLNAYDLELWLPNPNPDIDQFTSVSE